MMTTSNTTSVVDRTKRRRTIEASWVAGVLVFVIARFAIAYTTLSKYGLTVWVFGFLDIATAVPYAIGTARLVTSLVDRKPQAAARWGIIACASFLAPYVWVGWAGRHGQFPKLVYVVVALLVVCLGANAFVGIRRKVLQGRRTVAVDLPA